MRLLARFSEYWSSQVKDVPLSRGRARVRIPYTPLVSFRSWCRSLLVTLLRFTLYAISVEYEQPRGMKHFGSRGLEGIPDANEAYAASPYA